MVYSSALLIDDAYNSGISSSPTQQFAWHSALGTPAPPAIVMGVNIRIPRLLVVCAKNAIVTGSPRCLFVRVTYRAIFIANESDVCFLRSAV